MASETLTSEDLSVYNLYLKGVKLDILKTVADYDIGDTAIIIGSKVPEENTYIAEHASQTTAEVSKEPETQDSTAKAASPRTKLPVRSTHTIVKKKKNSKKCFFPNCNSAALRMIGSCLDCNGNFCLKHRLMENHLCAGLSNCKKAAFNRNASKLHLEQTISQKV